MDDRPTADQLPSFFFVVAAAIAPSVTSDRYQRRAKEAAVPFFASRVDGQRNFEHAHRATSSFLLFSSGGGAFTSEYVSE